MEENFTIFKETKENIYEVSDLGTIKKNGEVQPLILSRNGYYMYGGEYVHRIVAKAFVPNPENKPCVDHINTIRTDNRAENLQWVTYKENANNPLTLKHVSEGNKKFFEKEENRRINGIYSKNNWQNMSDEKKLKRNAKIGAAVKDKTFVNKDGQILHIPKSEIIDYIIDGWLYGFKPEGLCRLYRWNDITGKFSMKARINKKDVIKYIEEGWSPVKI